MEESYAPYHTSYNPFSLLTADLCFCRSQKDRSQKDMVGVNASIIGEDPTGLGVYSMRLVRELSHLRDDLVIYTSMPSALQCTKAKIVRIPKDTRPEHSMRGHFSRLLWIQTTLRLNARRDRITALVNPVPEGLVATRVPQVTVIHDLLPLRFPAQYPRQKYYFKFFVPRVLRESAVVVADSGSTRDDVLHFFQLPASRIRIVHAGCDSHVYFPNRTTTTADDVPYCLYVGNLLPHKNLPVLIDAMAIVNRRARCRLIIRGAGRVDYRRLLQTRIQSLGLTDGVTFLGYMSETTLRRLYQRAACLVLPSLGEGFGLPAIEAMACGTPVIVADTTSLPEVVGDAALQVVPDDPMAWAAAVHRLLSDEELRQNMRRAGLIRASAFSWKRTAEKISQAIDDALTNHERPAVWSRKT